MLFLALPYLVHFNLAFALVAHAALKPSPPSQVAMAADPEPTCWTGQIHDPCDGSLTGCTTWGALVRDSALKLRAVSFMSSSCGLVPPFWIANN